MTSLGRLFQMTATVLLIAALLKPDFVHGQSPVPEAPSIDGVTSIETWVEQQPNGDATSISAQPESRTTAVCGFSAPTLLTPINNVQVNTLIPRFEWANTGTSRYRLQLSTQSNFATLVWNIYWGGLTSNPVSVMDNNNLAANTTYYWRAASICSDGSQSAFSATAAFKTGNVVGPFLNPPEIVRPADGTQTPSLTVSFEWKNLAGALAYQIRYYRTLNDAQNDNSFMSMWSSRWATSTIDILDEDGTYYWRLLVRDDRAWGPLSPVRSFTITQPEYSFGFNVFPDGYNFANYGGQNLNDFTIGDMRRMFGDSAVCIMVKSLCIPRLSAIRWNLDVHKYMEGGHCDGFTVSGLRFFKQIDSLETIQSGAQRIYALLLANARRNIAYYWVHQVPNPVATARNQALELTPTQVLEQLKQAMSGGAPDPTTLIVYNSGRTAGHSVTPYALDDQGGGNWWIWVYDNNWPLDSSRHVVVNTTNNTWSYDLGGGIGTWSGSVSSHSIGVIPISRYAQSAECPWCTEASAASATATHAQISADLGDLLITDAQGRRLGVSGGQTYSEIPDAFGSVLPGGLGTATPPLYYVPAQATVTVTLSSGSVQASDGRVSEVTVSQYGPGYSVSLAGLSSGALPSQIAVTPDGTAVDYAPTNQDEATIVLATEGDRTSDEFQIGNVGVGSGDNVKVAVDASSGQLMLDNANNTASSYDLVINRIFSTGDQHLFANSGVPVGATDTHHIDYGQWTGTEPITVTVDVGSTGTLTQTIVLENQIVPQVYLPIVNREE